MSETNQTIVRRIYEDILNLGEVELADELIHPEAIDHSADGLSSLPSAGPEQLKEFVPLICASFPDVSWEIEAIVEVGDMVIVRTTGNQHAEFSGMMLAGRELDTTVVDVVRLREGRVVEHWGRLPL
jgi:predicted SnoaL-like aldol condensation-catalyzing enzyme